MQYDLSNWRVELRMVDVLFSGHIKANSKDEPAYEKPSITVTFQNISVKGTCFPDACMKDVLTIIRNYWPSEQMDM